MTTSISQLIPLLSPTPYLLSYALPLLLISLLLFLSGTFLTLDRSRMFPPADDGSVTGYASLTPGRLPSLDKKKRKYNWILEGGVGGLAGGYAFGVHLSTALALLIPATTSSAALSPKSFLAIWVLSCIVTTFLAGRYRYAAFAFIGISGGTLTGLAICIITHPALSSRIILVGLFLPLFTVLVLLVAILPVPWLANNLFHPFLRLCTASTGAFGLVLSVALLLNPQEEGWANAWERLWLASSPPNFQGQVAWGTGQEQGLSTAYVVFLVAGISADWALRRWIGECPDQKWDNYLADYAAKLPNQADRAGTFQPLPSIWDRIFSFGRPRSPLDKKDIVLPNETDMKTGLHPQNLPLPVTMMNVPNVSPKKLGRTGSRKEQKESKEIELTHVPSLKKKRGKRYGGWLAANESQGGRKGRKPVKFGEFSSSSSSSSSDDEKAEKPSVSLAGTKPALGHSYSSSSTPTLVGSNGNVQHNPAKHKSKYKSQPKSKTKDRLSSDDYALDTPCPTMDPRLDTLETLDYDQEIAQLKGRFRRSEAEGEPLEYSDYETEQVLSGKQRKPPATTSAPNAEWSPAFLQRHQSQGQKKTTGGNNRRTPLPGPIPVPATPSLIMALERLALAHHDALGSSAAAGAGAGAAPSNPGARSGLGGKDHVVVAGSGASEDEDEIPKAPALRRTKTLRAPRWEEFWRDVLVKSQT